jgi:hypothetical protein
MRACDVRITHTSANRIVITLLIRILRRRWLSHVGGFSVQGYLGRNTVND